MGGGKTTKSQVIEALGYTPAGGKNLVLNSNIPHTSAEYMMATYELSEEIILNEYYTVTIWGSLGNDREAFAAFIGGGVNNFGDMKQIADGVYRSSAKNTEWNASTGSKKSILVFQKKMGAITSSTVNKIKIEPGIVTDPVWTPAPEDVVTKTPEDVVEALGYEPASHDEMIARNTTIKIEGVNGDTFAKKLAGCLNGMYHLTFDGQLSDNPFSFNNGHVISLHCWQLYASTRFLLVGFSYDGKTMETKIFDIPSADELADDMEIN